MTEAIQTIENIVSVHDGKAVTVSRFLPWASNPVKGGRIPSGRERAIITQPHLFGYSLLIKMNRQIGG